MSRVSKKSLVLIEIFQACNKSKNFVFDNDLIKKYCRIHKFGNPFDVTKLDNTDKVPKILKDNDYFVVHLGEGKHQFVKGIDKGFHKFENIKDKDIQDWEYKKSLLNEYDTSESNILSIGSNQKIIHHFLYGDITANPKVYNSKRTKMSFAYRIGDQNIQAQNLQMEMDQTMELHGEVTIFEGKNNFPDDFAIYQLFFPSLYYQKLKEENELNIKSISCCYLLRQKGKKNSVIKLYNYTFTDKQNMASIKLLKSRQYNLIQI